MIGSFPPPTHGMSVVNKVVCERLLSTGATTDVFDISAPNLDNRFIFRLSRLHKVILSMVRLACVRGLKGAKLYLSVSGQLGQIYEIFFALLARLRGMSLILHHHSFAYLDKRRPLTQILINIVGSSTIHIALCDQMAKKLRINYKASKTVIVSNAVFSFHDDVSIKRSRVKLRTIGFISNISAQKGVFEFLDLMVKIEAENLSLQAKMAGPFQNSSIEHVVRRRLSKMQNVKYVGPRYETDKDAFFKHIDVLAFPTRYENEAEPLIVLEAMSHGVAIIAYGRGCIPEILESDCGRVIDTIDEFVPAAFDQIKTWLNHPTAFEAASRRAAHKFKQIYVQNNQRWMELLNNLIGKRTTRNACRQI